MALTPVTMTGSTDTIKEGFTKVNDIIDDLAAVTTGLGASCIGVFDTAGNMAATDVEAALAEIYTDVTSARTLSDIFDENPATTTGLTFGYKGGSIRVDNTVTTVAAGTISVTDDSINYIEISQAGVVSRNGTGFTAGYIPIRQVTAAGGVQTVSTDKRAWFVQSAAATDAIFGTVELATDAETVTGTSDVVVVTPGNITARLAAPGAIGGTTPATEVTIANTGLHVLDTNASHDLIIKPGSDLTADKTLTLTTGDADRTVTLSGNPTLSDWFDQAVKQASSPTFGGLTLTADLTVANGGTGASTLTDFGVLVGSGTAAVTALAAATNGQLVIGSTGADPAVAAITQGTGITITNAAGAITITHPAHTGDVTGDAALTIGAAKVTQSMLKTSSGEITFTASGTTALPGGTYGFYPQVTGGLTTGGAWSGTFTIGDVSGSSTKGTHTTQITYVLATGDRGYAQQRYVTASGEVHWIFILIDKATGKRIAAYEAPDHPCFGNRGSVHPFPDYDPLKHEIIVVNPSLKIVEGIELARFEPDYTKPEKGFLEKFDEIYDIDETKQADWPGIPITVALPRVFGGKIVDDWRFIPHGTILNPVKQIIKKPDFITPLGIRVK